MAHSYSPSRTYPITGPVWRCGLPAWPGSSVTSTTVTFVSLPSSFSTMSHAEIGLAVSFSSWRATAIPPTPIKAPAAKTSAIRAPPPRSPRFPAFMIAAPFRECGPPMICMILASARRNYRDDCLAGTAIAHRFTRVRCRRLSEWKHGAHDGPQLPGVQHRRDVAELPPIGFDKKQGLLRAFIIGRFDGAHNGDESSAGTQHAPGALQGRAADGVEHHVHVLGNVLEALGVIVDDLLSAESQQEVAVVSGRGCQDMGAAPARELNREDSYRPCAPVNEHALARLQVGPLKQALPGCQRVDRDARRLHMGQPGRLGCDRGRRRAAEFRGGALCIPIVHAEYVLTDDAVGPDANRGDGPRKLVARDGMAAVFARFGVRGRLPQQFGAGHANRMDPYQDLATLGLRCLDLRLHQSRHGPVIVALPGVHFAPHRQGRFFLRPIGSRSR